MALDISIVAVAGFVSWAVEKAKIKGEGCHGFGWPYVRSLKKVIEESGAGVVGAGMKAC